MKYLFLILISISLLGCKHKEKDMPIVVEEDEELIHFVTAMTGSFTNSQQAKKDSLYRDVTMHVYPIWESRNGHWLYSEEKLSDTLATPYRQRIYNIRRENDSVFKNEIYTFPNESLWTGKWENPDDFNKLLYETLIPSTGCDIHFTKVKNHTFIGRSEGKICPTTIHGATYMTTEIEINEHNIITRERGFNAKDSLVWGPKEDGYIFVRIKE